MRNDEILPSCFTYDSRIGLVSRHAGADRLPHIVEDGGAAGEVHTGEITVREQLVRDQGRIAWDEVDDSRRKPRFLEELHDVVRAQHGARRRLPYDSVSHLRRPG